MAKMSAALIVSLIDKVTGPARAVSRSMSALNAASRANARQMAAVRGEMLGAVGAAYVMARAISAPVSAAMEFESAMADVRKVVDFETPQQFKQLSSDIISLSQELPIAATGIADIVAAAGQAGMAGAELLEFAEMAAKVGVAFDISADLSGEALAKIKTALNLSVGETGALADAINHLTNNMASSAPDMIDFMRRAGAVGQQYGFAAAETAAIGSAMIAAGAQANVAATSFRNVGRALTKGAAATKAQNKAFSALGLEATAVAKSMQEDATGTLQDVLERIRALPKEIQAATLSQLFGDEARALAPLVENLQLYEEALGSVADQSTYLGSAEAEYAQRADTSANKLQLLQNQMQSVAISIGNALLPAVVSVAEALGPMLAAIGQFAQDHPQIVAAAAAIAGGLVALNVAAIATRFAFLFMKGGVLSAATALVGTVGTLLSLLNPLNLLKNAAVALRLAMLFTGVGAVVAAIAAAGLLIYNNWDGLVSFFEGFSTGLMAGLAPLMPVIQPIVDAGKELLGWVTGLLGPIGATNDEWKNWGKTIGGSVASAINTVIGLFEKLVGWIGGAVDAAMRFGSAVASIVSGGEGSPVPSTHDATGVDYNAYMPGIGTRALGGPVRAGLTYLTGERGRELFTAPSDGYIHNARETARMLAGLGSGLSVAPSAPSMSMAGNSNAANSNGGGASQIIQFGDIIVRNPVNASPQAVAQAVGDEVALRVRGTYSDGGQ